MQDVTTKDAGSLSVIAALAFYNDRTWPPERVRLGNLAQVNPSKRLPHTSDAWTRDRRIVGAHHTTNCKLVLGQDRLVGGLLAVARPDLGDGEWRCEAIYIDPDYHNRGIGKEVLRQMYRNHPDALRWTLDTPAWAVRNHGFYERMGFTKFAVSSNYGAPFDFFDFENALSQEERLRL